jgi:hypothetical protein
VPLTLTISRGALPEGAEKQAFARLAEAFVRLHGLAGNRFLTPNVVGAIHVVEHAFSGLEPRPVAFVEWKVPSFAFTDRAIQKAYVAEATAIVHELSGGRLPKSQVWVNVTHAVDGAWGIGGVAFTNAELGEAVGRG